MKSSENHRFSDDFMGNRSQLIHLNLFNIKSKIWRLSLTLVKALMLKGYRTQKSRKFLKHFILLVSFYNPWKHKKNNGFLNVLVVEKKISDFMD